MIQTQITSMEEIKEQRTLELEDMREWRVLCSELRLELAHLTQQTKRNENGNSN